jgi:hypothetical protein
LDIDRVSQADNPRMTAAATHVRPHEYRSIPILRHTQVSPEGTFLVRGTSVAKRWLTDERPAPDQIESRLWRALAKRIGHSRIARAARLKPGDRVERTLAHRLHRDDPSGIELRLTLSESFKPPGGR